MAGSRLVYDFTHNASARFRPPYWVKGEDSSFGFFVHISPFQTVRRLGIPLGHKGRRSLAAHGPRLHLLTPPLPLLPLQVTPIHWGWEVVT